MALKKLSLPLMHTIDEDRERKNTSAPSQEQTSAFDQLVAPILDKAELRRKALALASDPNAPSGMKVSDYLDALAANGGMDADTKAAYDADKEEKAKDLKKQSQLAAALAIQKERELDAYKKSDEHKQKAPVTTNVYSDSAAGQAGAAVGQLIANFLLTGSLTGDEKEGTLKAEKDYFQNLSGTLLDQDTMEKDLATLSTWTEEDKKALEGWYVYKNFTGAMDTGGTSDAPAAWSRLRSKYGGDTVDKIFESYSRSQNAQLAEGAAAFGKENSGVLDTAVSIPLSWVGSVASSVSQGSQALKDTLGFTTGRYKTNDTNTPGDLLSIYAGAVQQQAAENAGEWGKATAEAHGASKEVQEIAGKGASTATQVGISALDNIGKVYLTGGAGSLALAATGSFSSAMRQASQQGASPQQAAMMGFVSAASEVLTEKLPLDNLLKNVGKGADLSNIGKLVLEAGKQAGIELATEEVNFLAGLLAEAAILREKSDYRQAIADAVANGASYEEAARQANAALLQEAGQVALQSGLSGFLTSGASSVITGTDSSGRLPQAADTYQQQKTDSAAYVDDLLSRLPIRKDTTTQADTTKAQSPIADVVTELLERGEGQSDSAAPAAPAAPIAELLKLAAQGKPVTNKQATGILNNPEAVQKLTQETGLNLDGLTASGKRNAVKDIIADILSRQQAGSAVDTAQNTDYDNKNTTGGTENGTEQEAPSLYGRGIAGTSGLQGAARPEDGNRPGIQSGVGEIFGGSSETRASERGIDTRMEPFAASDYYTPEQNSELASAQRAFKDEYGLECRTVKASAWRRSSPAFIRNGTVYVSEGIDTDTLKTLVPHESTHAMAQLHFEPYADFLIRTPDMIDLSRTETQELLSMVAEHCGIDIFSMDDYQQNKLFSELNATIYGMHKGGILSMPEYPYGNLASAAFRDFDGYATELDSIHEQYRTQAKAARNSTPADGAVGAAEQNFTGRAAYQELLSDENSQPDRPGDVRPMEVPETDGYGRNVSHFVGNAYGAEVTPDSFVPVIEELVQEGALGYDTRTNAQSLKDAAAVIEKKGMAGARNAITKNISNGKVGDTDIATAMLLYSKYAAQKGQQAQDSAAELFVDLQMMSTQSGRNLQLFKMLRKLTPQGQLMAVTKKVDRYVESLNKGRSEGNRAEVTIPKELTDAYVEAAQEAAVTDTPENQQRKDEAEQAIYAYAAANIKATLKEKWDSWRYLAMLGNPKTQIRNMVGNALFRPFVETKRYLGTAMEAMVLKPEQRTKALLGADENSRALLKWAKEDAKTQAVTDRMDYTATTGDSANSDIGDKRQIFKTRALEAARTGLNDLMTAEDMLFKRSAYATSLASFLKARGVTAQQLSDGTVDAATMEAARNYAVEEAMKATFNDRNALSNALVNLRYKGSNPAMKVLNAAAEGILPFRRTPANIVARAVEYSPIGLAKTITADAVRVAKGQITAAEYIDDLAAGLTGTGAMALGYGLAAGIFEGVRLVGNEDDEDEKRTGHQSYALEIGDTSITIDWAAPMVLPLFMGANLYSALNPDGEEVSTSHFTAFLEACATSLEPMLELSCLSSLNDLATDIRYAEDGRWLYSVAASAATSYLLQGLPTLGGQIEQAFEGEKKSVYTDSSDPVVKQLQQVVGRATQKIPGIDLFQAEKVDAWGQTKEEKGTAQSVFDAFLNPSYTSTVRETEADTEISWLNGVRDENVSPNTPGKKLSYKDSDGNQVTNRILTAEEYTALAKTQGQKQKELVESILKNSAYAALTDEQKADALGYAYAYAKDYARGEVLSDHPGITTKWMAALKGDIAEGILRRVAVGTTDKYASLPIEKVSYVDELLSGLWDNPREAKPDGTKYASVRDIQKIEAVVAADSQLAEAQQRQVLQDILDEKAFAKYEEVMALGYDNDEYAAIYRLYLDTDGGKDDTIRALMREQGLTYAAAKQLYEIYSPPRT